MSPNVTWASQMQDNIASQQFLSGSVCEGVV